MAEILDMDWAQHIKMDYAQNLRKYPKKAKQTTFRKFKEDIACPFSQMYWNPMKSNEIQSWNIRGFMKIENTWLGFRYWTIFCIYFVWELPKSPKLKILKQFHGFLTTKTLLPSQQCALIARNYKFDLSEHTLTLLKK